jgi:hypothetical protein
MPITAKQLEDQVAQLRTENGRLRAALEEISNMTLDEPMRGVAKRALAAHN